METDMGLYSHDNKENALRRRISGSNLQTARPCLTDITHKFVPKENPVQVSKNVGLFKLATGGKNGGGSIRSTLPR